MFSHFLPGDFHFLFQFPGRHAQNAAAERTKLHQRVGGCHANSVVVADFSCQSFDVSIRGLAFLGIDHLDVVELALFAGISLLLPAVENHHQAALGKTRKTA